MKNVLKLLVLAAAAVFVLSGCSVESATAVPDEQSTSVVDAEVETEPEAEAEPTPEMHGTALNWELSDFERENLIEANSLGDGSGFEVGEPLRQYSYYADGGLEWDYTYIYPIYEGGSLVRFTYLEVFYDNWDAVSEDATPADFEGKDGVDWIGSAIAKETGAGSNAGLATVADFKDQGAEGGIYVYAADGLWFFDGNELTLVDDNTVIYMGMTYADMGYASLADVSDMSIFDDVVLSNPSHVVPLGE